VFAVIQQLQSFFYTKELGSGAGRRSVPKKQARKFLGELNAYSLPLWPFLQRQFRVETINSARKSLTKT
jgi:hypothetical protein